MLFVLAFLLWLASGVRWPGLSDPQGDWFRFVSQLSATVIGGLIAAGVTWHFSERKKSDDNRASLSRLFLHLIQIAGALANTVRTIDEMLTDANAAGHTNLPMWARVLPITGLAEIKDVELADLAPLLNLKDLSVVDQVILLNQRYQSSLDALKKYNELRIDLRNHISVHGQIGRVATTNLAPEELSAVQPRLTELDDLISEILIHMREDLLFARSTLDKFSKAAAKATNRPFPTVTHIT